MGALKGWRTIIFNVLMSVIMAYALFRPEADLPSGADVNATLASLETAITAVWGLGNVLLRAITNTPIGKAEP